MSRSRSHQGVVLAVGEVVDVVAGSLGIVVGGAEEAGGCRRKAESHIFGFQVIEQQVAKVAHTDEH
jgi:hypothetical protein